MWSKYFWKQSKKIWLIIVLNEKKLTFSGVKLILWLNNDSKTFYRNFIYSQIIFLPLLLFDIVAGILQKKKLFKFINAISVWNWNKNSSSNYDFISSVIVRSKDVHFGTIAIDHKSWPKQIFMHLRLLSQATEITYRNLRYCWNNKTSIISWTTPDVRACWITCVMSTSVEWKKKTMHNLTTYTHLNHELVYKNLFCIETALAFWWAFSFGWIFENITQKVHV